MHTLADLTIISAAFLAALLAGCSESQSQQNASVQSGAPPVFDDPQAAAEQAIQSFRNLVDGENYRELGFDAPEDGKNAELGERLPIFLVRLDQLKGYQAGDDTGALLADVGQFLYLVTFMNQPRCSIVVERVDGKWRTASLGNSGLAKQVALLKGAAADSSVVQVPALGVYFIGNTWPDGNLALTPLATNETLKLKVGETRTADEVFATLAGFAQSRNDDPM